MNEFVLILFVVAIGILVSVVKYIVNEKKSQKTTYSDVLIRMIKAVLYKKSVLDNDYPNYPGELEKKDVDEYVSYLHTGVTKLIDEDAQ